MLLELLLNPIFYIPCDLMMKALPHMCLTSQYLATDYLVSFSLSILERPDGLCLQDLGSPDTLLQVSTHDFNQSSSESEISKPLPLCWNHLNHMLAVITSQDPTCLPNYLVTRHPEPLTVVVALHLFWLRPYLNLQTRH